MIEWYYFVLHVTLHGLVELDEQDTLFLTNNLQEIAQIIIGILILSRFLIIRDAL